MMRLSDTGAKFIKAREELRLRSYQDIAGIWTIGYGHTKTAHENQTISEERADALFLMDVEEFEKAVNSVVKVPVTQNQFDAMVSLAYNIGSTAFKNSTVVKWLNAKKPITSVAEAFTWWNKANVDGVLRPVQGLRNRRAAEVKMFLGRD